VPPVVTGVPTPLTIRKMAILPRLSCSVRVVLSASSEASVSRATRSAKPHSTNAGLDCRLMSCFDMELLVVGPNKEA